MNAVTSNHLAKGRPPESNLYVMWQTNLAGLFTGVDRAVCKCIVLWKCGVWSIECKVELCMQDLELMASSLWIPEFTEPHNTFEHAATDHRASIMACWESLQTFFSRLKKVAFALISVFGSTYMSEQVVFFTSQDCVLKSSHSQLTTHHSQTCVQLKVSTCRSDIAWLSSERQRRGLH